MKTFTFRYAMSIDINANSEEEAQEIFESMDFYKVLIESEYVELEDISENNW